MKKFLILTLFILLVGCKDNSKTIKGQIVSLECRYSNGGIAGNMKELFVYHKER